MKSILVPTDFSPASRPAMDMALFIARHTGAKIIFFHLTYFSETRARFGITYEQVYREAVASSREKLKAMVEEFLKNEKDKKEIKYDLRIQFGPSASDAILETAEDKKVALIVMGTHGATGLKKVFFGSNAAHVIAAGKFPVLAVPPAKSFVEPKKIYYSTDLSNSPPEVDTVKKFALKCDLGLDIIFIDYGWAKSTQEQKRLARLKTQGAPFTIIKTNLETPLHKKLREFMRGKNNGILCLFHKRKSGIATFLFGSNAESLSITPEFPLLVFPK